MAILKRRKVDLKGQDQSMLIVLRENKMTDSIVDWALIEYTQKTL